MTPLWIYLLTAIGGYLIGSVSFARLVFAKLKPGEKPELIRIPTTDGQAELVSHAVGAANVMLAFGSRWGMLVTALDMLKATIPTLAMRIIFPDDNYYLVVAVAVLVGHLWPVWYKFSGGGGNSSIIGMMLAISPLGLLITHAGGMLIGRFAPMLAFVGGVALTIPWFAFRDGLFSPEVAFAVVITILYLLADLAEIREVNALKRKGHKMEYGHVMSMMKKSAATGEPGKETTDSPIQSKEERP
jgi:acyl phosphate:glycerol-3-phosphate acyltransferase